MRVLLVEDDETLSELVLRRFKKEGLVADHASDGEQAVAMARASQFDVIVLDVMLGAGPDGVEVCRRLRDERISTPILMLTALGDLERRVEALTIGADDYLTKPFEFAELIARVHALARRAGTVRPPILVVGSLRLDPAAHRAWRGVHEVELPRKEFLLLETLMRHPGQALSRQQLIEAAWDTEYEAKSNVVDVSIRQLREKVDRPYGEHSIETVRGVGYRVIA